MGIASIIGIASSCLQAVTQAASPNTSTPFDQLLKSLQDHHVNLGSK